MELVFKIVIGHGTLQGSDGMLDVNMNRATIGQGGHRINTGFVHAAVDNGVDFAAHIDHVGAIHDIVSVLLFGGPAKNQAGSAAVLDADLALQAVGGVLLTCKLQNPRQIGSESCREWIDQYV